MIKWIMKCVTSVYSSININGDLHGYFKGKRGLRQGDPMSPYLFTLVMETLSLFLRRNILNSGEFRFHSRCEEQQIVNVCFANDLFLFSHGSIDSAKVISDALEEFKVCSGLVPSVQKSTAFFCNVRSSVNNAILELMPYDEGVLPVKYLGVPLVSSRLMIKDCKVLVDKVKCKIDDWKNKFLSFAGRVQLITSILSSMQVYWSSVFILPDNIIKEIEKLMRGFLWCNGPLNRGKAKVKWKEVCSSKNEGVGDGLSASAWFDTWCDYGPLASIVSMRDINRAGYNKDATVADLISDATWNWQIEWRCKYPMLSNISIPDISDPDVVKWRGPDGNLQDFSVRLVWDSLRQRAPIVGWSHMVWFSQNIPRHALILWLLIKDKLMTQDRLKPWDLRTQGGVTLLCSLCKFQQDSQSHLFFECTFSSQFWSKIMMLFHLPSSSLDWKEWMAILSPYAHRRVARVMVAKIAFAASIYYIWQERNSRLFKGEYRSVEQLFQTIFSTVRLKLLSLKFKKSVHINRIRSTWMIA
ncbi:uncharacterized protein [Rutidosis leptorrhynchoides]|uniref:uncharacterized protein n=1 Tax=Rutidosis leptorrhynchoides TaxID=125765 RepID=UPI003A9A1C3E